MGLNNVTHGRLISVIGLGYVGLPVAVAFGRQHEVIGFDINASRIAELRSGHDSTREVEDAEFARTDIHFTSDPAELKQADFHIVAVPTPIDTAKRPDLGPLLSASRTLGKQLKGGDIVVYESTVYPGATEEDCIPILEQESGLQAGFFCWLLARAHQPRRNTDSLPLRKWFPPRHRNRWRRWQLCTSPWSRPAYTRHPPSR